MKTIFYSWQSDLPNRTNRGFISIALEKATKKLNRHDEIGLELAVDRDTLNISGAPDIAKTIFEKIDCSIAFVCDVSLINPNKYRITPNPNVLVELGYAVKSLGWDNIVLIANTFYGNIEQLPFDLRGRRIISYNLAKDSTQISSERSELEKKLFGAINYILKNNAAKQSGTRDNSLKKEYIQADRELFKHFISILPSDAIFNIDSTKTVHMESCDDGNYSSLFNEAVQPLMLFTIKWGKADHMFLDSELEEMSIELKTCVESFVKSNKCDEMKIIAPQIISKYNNFVRKAKIQLGA
ncbi:MAG: nucleotide-binding protein [Desulfobacula sp.]|uniref:hypothetical protein n=1 Tax=Desulfobacula sp. TaxID=2593537 RepID=UPI0025BCBBF1|nr:hypothetical protein [Desulfobacula sp.]MCD4720913.1 nucleotide-binding protein [Desulfobacula sp.]